MIKMLFGTAGEISMGRYFVDGVWRIIYEAMYLSDKYIYLKHFEWKIKL